MCLISCGVHLSSFSSSRAIQVQTKQLQEPTAAVSLVHPPPHPIITLESLWLCTPSYYCQPIKTKASRIMKRIMLYTREKDLTGGILPTTSITPPPWI